MHFQCSELKRDTFEILADAPLCSKVIVEAINIALQTPEIEMKRCGNKDVLMF